MELTLNFFSLDDFDQQIGKANKSLKKLGLPEVSVKEMSIVSTKVDCLYRETGTIETPCEYDTALEVLQSINPSYRHKQYKAIVDVPEALVRYKGWEIIARLEKLGAGMIITPIAEGRFDFSQYRQLDHVPCHHCNVQSSVRKRGWVARHEDGREIVVGDTCCKEYFGVDVEAILKGCEFIMHLGPVDSDRDFSRAARHFAYAELTMRLALFEILEHGFVPKKFEEKSTVTRVNNLLFLLTAWLLNDDDQKEKNELMRQLRDRDEQLTQIFNQMMTWYDTAAFTDDFMQNVKAAALSYSYKHSGLLIMASYNYLKEIGLAYKTEIKESTPFTKAFFGNVKDKFSELKVTLRRIKVIDGAYGTKILYTFQDEEGNAIAWNSSKNLHLTVSNTYLLKGTVKEHNTWNDWYTTYVTRCTVTPIGE